MRVIIKYEDQLFTGCRRITWNPIANKARVFESMSEAKSWAKLSCYTRPEFLKQED